MNERKTMTVHDTSGDVKVSICEIHDQVPEHGLHVIMTVERPGMTGRVVVDVGEDASKQFGDAQPIRDQYVDLAMESALEIARGNLAADRIDEGRVAWLDLGRRMMEMPGHNFDEKATAYRRSIEMRPT